ncbi:MAG TPA: MFS transporter [Anaerolineales bacterium]|nr:MFS transporter [Anaerolineales bacterium]
MTTEQSEKFTESPKFSAPDRRNFIAGLWHGAFLALGVSLTQPTTVISAFVADLTGSTVWVGGLATVLTVAGTLPQIFVARWIEPLPRKMPYLMLAIYLRVFSWGLLSWLIYRIGAEEPILLAWILVGMLIVFYAGGGLGNIPYTDIIGKIIPANRRGAFFGGMGALAGPLSVGAALGARQILAQVDYPNNYALLFGLAAVGLGIASLGFWFMREPPADPKERHPVPPWSTYWRQLQAASRRLKTLISIELLTGFSLMALPFYVVYARQELGAPTEAVGWFLLAQVIGGVFANLFWARLVDRAGSRRMLTVCALVSTLNPLLAVALAPLGWPALGLVFFLAGATFNGRKVGFQSALLELAPVAERPTYAGLNAVLILPLAFFSLGAGFFLQQWSYRTLFVLAAIFIGTGAVVAYRWAQTVPVKE